jgi:hypothetical protein
MFVDGKPKQTKFSFDFGDIHWSSQMVAAFADQDLNCQME